MVESKAHTGANGHLKDSLCHTAKGGSIRGFDLAAIHQRLDLCVKGFERFGFGKACFREGGFEPYNGIARFFKFRGNNLARGESGHSEGHQCGRNVNLLEATAHRVLTANCRHTKTHLRTVCTEQRRKRNAPTLGILAGFCEVFLEGQIYVFKGSACSNQLGNRFHNGKICAVIRCFFCDKGIIAPCHRRAILGDALKGGNAVDHGLNRRKLLLAAKRHQHRARADGAVEAFGKAALGANVEIGKERIVALCKAFGRRFCVCFRLGRFNGDMLFRTVGV